jgi:plasmid stabilization system protein ParE
MTPAKREIRQISKYISDDVGNPAAALRRIDLIDEKIQSLKENPKRYPLVQDEYLASKGYRWVAAKSHIIFFIIREEINTVSVMRVLHGRRDFVNMLKTDEE